ncbi:calcium-binding protein [Microvirga sp. 3-52]|uniref:M10 family metallopeptidase C-terminal domain-containing protein n=1 Tax=Microvirga sp. 3-52 TaxID=2792425 RepID=UPI0024BD6517|nr:calcium-binding protein [Microvirga sp. 3-52]
MSFDTDNRIERSEPAYGATAGHKVAEHKNIEGLDDIHVITDAPYTINVPPGLISPGGMVVITTKPSGNFVFTPHPSYWITFGKYEDGEVISLSDSIAEPGEYTITLSALTSGAVQSEVSFDLIIHEPGTIRAGSGDDDVYGSTSIDALSGGSGDDLLAGGQGRDVLQGGSGQDSFVFDTKPNKAKNLDRITDFNVTDDSIWLDNKVFTKLGKAGSSDKPALLKKDFFVEGSKAKDKNDHVLYDSKTGMLFYDADGSGKVKPVEIATLS